jgi:serine/threonine protein kinase
MICPSCRSANEDDAAACFTCGKALFALTQGILLGGRYEILRPLGQGGMGRVYKAHDRILDEAVAIKLLRPELTLDDEMARRFRSEIKLARRVSHPNVCRIHEYSQDGDLAYISMEYIEGRNLKEHLDATPPSTEEAFDLSLQIAQGLKAVHDHGIIHRDFKASNVMVDRQGVVKLMDFGIAKDAAVDTTGFSGSGVLGTPEYMSPEQGAGGKVDFRSDVYSLGCVVFEIFAGRPPFRGDTPLATLYKHQNEPPPLDSRRIPDALVPVLRSALAKNPDERHGGVSDLIAALRAARRAAGSPPPTHETTTLDKGKAPARHPERPGPRSQVARQLWPWAALVVAAIGAVAALDKLSPSRPSEAPAAAAPSAAAPAATQPEVHPSRAPERASPSAEVVPARATVSPPATLAPTPSTTPSPPRARVATPPPPPTAAPSAQPSPSPAAPSSPSPLQGILTLLIVPEAEVTVDGLSLGRVSMRELSLDPGPHTLRVRHPDYEPLQRRVTIRPGVDGKLVLDLAEKGIPKRPE